MLLPAEIELCEAVGLSEEEYWHFVEEAELYNGERDEAYALIPDIKNEPATTAALVSLAIGLVTTGVSMLLAPKPKSPQIEEREGPRSLTLGGQRGVDRFAQTDGFQSVQELAELGQTIPLVFTNKGVRVNGSLVWSQMIAERRFQQLRAVFVFSDGYTEGIPDYEGLAIGDTLLQGYNAKKVAAYWRQAGGRLIEPTNRIVGSEAPLLPYSDAFGTYSDYTLDIEPWFSGATFTSVQSQFGAYSPMVAGSWFQPVPQLVLVPDEAEDDFKDDLRKKQVLYDDAKFSHGQFFSSYITPDGAESVGFGALYYGYLPKDYYLKYRLTTYLENEDDDRYTPESLTFVNSATISSRIAADSQIAVGDLYLLGRETLGVCTSIQGTAGAYEPWSPGGSLDDYVRPALNDKSMLFQVTDPGFVDTIQPQGTLVASENYAIQYPFAPSGSYALQRAAVATVSNTRPCSSTEIIVKSNVWRQISGFTDVNAWPSQQLIADYEANGGSIQLGTLNKYIRRLSFFMLEVRDAGTNTWIDITGGKYFFVEGNTPVDQYHYIRVNTATRGDVESEFRLRPISGLGAYRTAQAGTANGQYMRKLEYGSEDKYAINGYVVTYNGKEIVLDESYATNPEFIRAADSRSVTGGIENAGISPTEVGTFSVPGAYSWVAKAERYITTPGSRNFLAKRISFVNPYDNYWEYVWDNTVRATGKPLSQSEEPTQFARDSASSYVAYQWFLRTPGAENDLVDAYPYRTVFRSIRRWEYEQGAATNTDPAAAQVTPAKHISVANPDASGLKFYVRRWNNDLGQELGYKWTIDPSNKGTGYTPGDQVEVQWEDTPGTYRSIWRVTITGTVTVTEDERPSTNYSRFDAILDIPSFEGVSSSNANGPEHEIVAINEKLGQQKPEYDAMTIGGLRINSSSEWANFNSFSAYMKKGIILENLIDGSAKASNLLPDIVFGMMTNTDWGAGKILGAQQVDRDSMKIASQFCDANHFGWDGVVSDRINFRDWVFRNAQYCLLDATVIGGRFALVPAVPYTSTYEIGNFVKPQIKALFTDGNMRNMKVQWLSPEERQLFTAEMLWRQETLNGFAKTRQFTMRLADSEGGSSTDPIETFDMSGFCTTELHAARYAYYALRMRQQVDHTISFETTPQAAMGLIPGEYFKVSSNSSHTSRFNNGSINDEGYVTSVEDMSDGSYSIYYWRPGTEGISQGTVVILDGKATDSAFFNTVFTIVMTSEQTKVYKLEALTYGEDGLIEVTGSHMPLTNSGTLKILDWNPADFVGAGIIL